MLTLRKPWRDGTRAFVFSPMELTEKPYGPTPLPGSQATRTAGWAFAPAGGPSDRASAAMTDLAVCALVLQPHVRNVHFHGVFAANHASRREVVAFGRTPPPPERAEPDNEPELSLLRPPSPRAPSRRHAWCPWADLLEQEFGVNVLRCPHCGGILHLRAVVVGPPATTKILASMARSARGPP